MANTRTEKSATLQPFEFPNHFPTVKKYKTNPAIKKIIQAIPANHNKQESQTAISEIKSSPLLQKAAITFGYSSVCSSIIYPIDKLNFYFQTTPYTLSWPNALSRLYTNFFKGFGMHIGTASIKNFVTFTTKYQFSDILKVKFPCLSKITNDTLSGFSSGLLATYLLSPLYVVKTQVMLDKSIGMVINQLPLKAYYNGVHTKAGTDAIYTSLFFGLRAFLLQSLGVNEDTACDQSTWAKEACIGGLASFTAGFLSNPLSVVTTNLRSKTVPSTCFKVAKELYLTKGIAQGFWPKFIGTTSLRMFGQGVVWGAMAKSLDRVSHSHKNEIETVSEANEENNKTQLIKSSYQPK